METVHYLILAGAALAVAAILLPGFRRKTVPAVAPAPAIQQTGSLREAFRTLHDVAETRAYARLEDELADKRAGKLKAEIQDLFAAAPATDPNASPKS